MSEAREAETQEIDVGADEDAFEAARQAEGR